MRKVVEKGNIKEERIYLGDYEIFRKFVGSSIDTERETVHISDDNQKIAQIDGETIRYQLSDHLGSASLELDENAEIISYEEYYPFGTTSYRSGRNETEVSQKRYKYVMKELDNETGLYYYGIRFYASWICRFISVDPLQHEYPFYVPFQYSSNNPVTFYDLDGMETTKNENTGVDTNGQNYFRWTVTSCLSNYTDTSVNHTGEWSTVTNLSSIKTGVNGVSYLNGKQLFSRTGEHNRIIQLAKNTELNNTVDEWDIIDIATWKTIGGQSYIDAYKWLFVYAHANVINKAASTYNIDSVMLAAIVYSETGGDPLFVDDVQFRLYNFLGKEKLADKTSFGYVSIQV